MALAAVLALAACGPNGASVSPSPSATPTLAEGMTRFTGTVTDASTGYTLPGVCVIIGPTSACGDNMPHTDAFGVWSADLPVGNGLSWTFTFVKDGYQNGIASASLVPSGEQKIDIVLQPK